MRDKKSKLAANFGFPSPTLPLSRSPSLPIPDPKTPLGRVAGIDYGRVRMGVAISDPNRTLASPYENYTRRGDAADARRFQQLVEEDRVVLFVVGLPVHLDGRESELSLEARQFGQWLAAATHVPVEFFDERFSTSEAHELLKDAAMKHKRRKRKLDMIAAQVMLSAYLESQSKGGKSPGPL
jgi:putative Holliday junction resolvase